MNEEKFHIVKSKTDSYGPAGSVVGKASTSNRAWSSAQRHSDKNGGTSYHVKRVEEEAMAEEHRITVTNPGGTKTRFSVRRHSKSGKPIGQATIFSTRRAAEDHIARLNKPMSESVNVTIKKMMSDEPNVSKRDVTYDVYHNGVYHKTFKDVNDAVDHKENMQKKSVSEEMVANNMSGGAIADPKNKMLLKSPVKRFKEFVKS